VSLESRCGLLTSIGMGHLVVMFVSPAREVSFRYLDHIV
jgi:hypothetical protein